MKRIKIFPIIVSVALTVNTFSNESGFNNDAFNNSFSQSYGQILSDEGGQAFSLETDYNDPLPNAASYFKEDDDISAPVSPALLNYDFGMTAPQLSKNNIYYKESLFNSGSESFLSLHKGEKDCRKRVEDEAIDYLTTNFPDQTCLLKKDVPADYCGCIKDEVKKTGLNDKYGNADKETKEEMVIDGVDKMRKAYMMKRLNDAIFSYVATSEKVAFGILSNPQAKTNILAAQEKSKKPLCVPGNLQSLFDHVNNSGKNKCFSESDKKDMKETFLRYYKDRKGQFTNLKNDSYMNSSNIAQMSFDDVLKTTDSTIISGFNNGVMASSSTGVTDLMKAGNIENFAINSSKYGNEIIANRGLSMMSAYKLGMMLKKKEVGDPLDHNYQALLNDVEDIYVKDPLFREKFNSFSYEYYQENLKNAQNEKSDSGALGSNGLQYYGTWDYNIKDSFEVTRNQLARKNAIESMAEEMFKKVQERNGGKEPTFTEFQDSIQSLQQDAVEVNYGYCEKAFNDIEKLCALSTEEVFAKHIKTPDSLIDISNELVINKGQKQKEKNYKNFVSEHLTNGALACHMWYNKTAKGQPTTKSIECLECFEPSGTHAALETGEFVTGGFGDTIAEESPDEMNSEGFGGEEAKELVEATDSEYKSANGLSDSSSFGYKPNTTKIADYSRSNAGNFRNLASSSSEEDSGDSTITSNLDNSDTSQGNALVDSYNARIEEMQKKLDAMNKKLEEADKKKQQDEMDKLNEAIANATSTINKLQNDKKVLVEQLTQSNESTAVAGTKAQDAQTSYSEGDLAPLPAAPSAGASSPSKSSSVGSSGSSSSFGKNGLAIGPQGSSSDDALYRLHQESQQGETGTVLTLNSLKDPSIGDRVKNAFNAGDRVIYANVNGAVYRIIPQLDDNGKIIEEGGEVVFITEIVGQKLTDSELGDLGEDKKERAPASIGITEKETPEDSKYGYKDMMNLTKEALSNEKQ